MVYCIQCGTESDRQDKYCRICGSRLMSRQAILKHTVLQLKKQTSQMLPKSRPQTVKASYSSDGKLIPSTTTSSLPKLEESIQQKRFQTPELARTDTVTAQAPADTSQASAAPLGASAQLGTAEQRNTNDEASATRPTGSEFGTQLRKSIVRSLAPFQVILLGAGAFMLVMAVAFDSSIYAFIGLGLTFWGGLFLLMRPSHLMPYELMSSAALTSLRTNDNLVFDLGYRQRPIFVYSDKSDEVQMFIPSAAGGKIPSSDDIVDRVFVEDPKGVAITPVGSEIANLLVQYLGPMINQFDSKQFRNSLRKLIVDELKLSRDFDMNVENGHADFRFTDSVFAAFCYRLRLLTKVNQASPLSSAMACLLTRATRKPVVIGEESLSNDGRVIRSSLQIVSD